VGHQGQALNVRSHQPVWRKGPRAHRALCDSGLPRVWSRRTKRPPWA
jgi:hypothetical protein